MEGSKERIDFIIEYISAYEAKIKIANKNSLFDEAQLFELFAQEICNLWYGKKFTNLNSIKKNYPCVDLLSEDGEIYVQVSTQEDIPGKIKKTLLSLEEEKYDAFFKTSQSILCFLFVKPYIKESMKLSAYIAQEESEEVKKEIALIENMRIKPQQKLMSISNAFYFFLGKREEASCKQMLDYVKKLGDERTYNNLKIQYDIFILKESKHIDEIKKKLEIAQRNNMPNKDLMVGSLEYLIGLQYSYLNDKKNMMKYFKPALIHCKGTTYEVEMNQVIEKMNENI